MTQTEQKELMLAACKVRIGIIEGTHAAKAGHPGGSLSAADLFTYLYWKELRVDPKTPSGRTGTGSSSPRATPRRGCTPPWPTRDFSRWRTC